MACTLVLAQAQIIKYSTAHTTLSWYCFVKISNRPRKRKRKRKPESGCMHYPGEWHALGACSSAGIASARRQWAYHHFGVGVRVWLPKSNGRCKLNAVLNFSPVYVTGHARAKEMCYCRAYQRITLFACINSSDLAGSNSDLNFFCPDTLYLASISADILSFMFEMAIETGGLHF